MNTVDGVEFSPSGHCSGLNHTIKTIIGLIQGQLSAKLYCIPIYSMVRVLPLDNGVAHVLPFRSGCQSLVHHGSRCQPHEEWQRYTTDIEIGPSTIQITLARLHALQNIAFGALAPRNPCKALLLLAGLQLQRMALEGDGVANQSASTGLRPSQPRLAFFGR